MDSFSRWLPSRTAPVVSFVGEYNAATTTGWSVTVSGIDFGSLDTTPTARLGVSNCLTASWASTTSVTCFTTPGEGVENDAAMTVAGVVGTCTKTFSYDGAERCQDNASTCARGDRQCTSRR